MKPEKCLYPKAWSGVLKQENLNKIEEVDRYCAIQINKVYEKKINKKMSIYKTLVEKLKTFWPSASSKDI